jgi:hypothetical protein
MSKTEIAKFPECQQTCRRVELKGAADCINCDSYKAGVVEVGIREIKLVRKPNWKIVLDALDNGVTVKLGDHELVMHEKRIFMKVSRRYLVGAKLMDGFDGCLIEEQMNINAFFDICDRLSFLEISDIIHRSVMTKLENDVKSVARQLLKERDGQSSTKSG